MQSILPARFTKIDTLMQQDYYYLHENDDCWYLGEYMEGGYEASKVNNLIINFKKDLKWKNTNSWHYKDRAIKSIAASFRNALNLSKIDSLTFVPVPPSAEKSDPNYDDRIFRMLNLIRPSPSLDVRELVLQTETTVQSHRSEDRLSPSQLIDIYRIDEALLASKASTLVIVDDVITTGSHFRAIKTKLAPRFPGARIKGLFVARRVLASV